MTLNYTHIYTCKSSHPNFEVIVNVGMNTIQQNYTNVFTCIEINYLEMLCPLHVFLFSPILTL